jgi:hypothetical protein
MQFGNYSIRLLTKDDLHRFEVEGKIRRDYTTTSGELVDLIYYGLLND